MADNPHHPGRVALHPFFRFANKTDNALLQVIDAAGVVNDGMIFYLVKEAVDGQVPPEGIIWRRAIGVVGCQNIFSGFIIDTVQVELAPAAEGGDLDNLAAVKKDLHQPEASADQAAVLENFTELSRPCIGADVKILRGFTKVKVPDTTTDQVGYMPGITQTIEDLQCFPVNIFSGNGMFRPGNNAGGRDIFNGRASGSRISRHGYSFRG